MEAPTVTLPQPKPLNLTAANMALIARLAGIDLSAQLSKINRFNQVTKNTVVFVFVANTRNETGNSPQRIFEIHSILTSPADVKPAVARLQEEMPRHAIRIVEMFEGNLSSAVQYDPVDGRRNDEVSISD